MKKEKINTEQQEKIEIVKDVAEKFGQLDENDKAFIKGFMSGVLSAKKIS